MHVSTMARRPTEEVVSDTRHLPVITCRHMRCIFKFYVLLQNRPVGATTNGLQSAKPFTPRDLTWAASRATIQA